jgi:hypothetical protein
MREFFKSRYKHQIDPNKSGEIFYFFHESDSKLRSQD